MQRPATALIVQQPAMAVTVAPSDDSPYVVNRRMLSNKSVLQMALEEKERNKNKVRAEMLAARMAREERRNNKVALGQARRAVPLTGPEKYN